MNNVSARIQHLREDFSKAVLTENAAGTEPFVFFERWMNEALDAQVLEPQAMALSTAAPGGRIASRMVYLRFAHNHNFSFYGNYNSLKGQHLNAHPHAALLFFWPELQRQIRIEGQVNQMPTEQSAKYFNERPRGSQIGAWASDQSQKLNDRKQLENTEQIYLERFKNQDVPCPPFWGGWTLSACYYEFWQGRPSRLHDRIAFELHNQQWLKNRLSP